MITYNKNDLSFAGVNSMGWYTFWARNLGTENAPIIGTSEADAIWITHNTPGDETFLRGGGGGDVIMGDVSDNRIWGDAGDDRIEGEEGDDRLWGGSGNDSLL
ncbi:MAG: hypothetical protein GDA52_04455, partial [Rhodobacteraceae bacterium]|nr:hypothetical protein [Paracoccaceae bacterium]